jgi:hypothetical protein
MAKMFCAVALVVVAFATGSQAGTEIISDQSVTVPVPQRRPIYYAPPPPPVVVYPRVAYYGPRFGFYRHGHWYARHVYHHPHRWR